MILLHVMYKMSSPCTQVRLYTLPKTWVNIKLQNYVELGLHLEQEFGPQFHIEDEHIWEFLMTKKNHKIKYITTSQRNFLIWITWGENYRNIFASFFKRCRRSTNIQWLTLRCVMTKLSEFDYAKRFFLFLTKYFKVVFE